MKWETISGGNEIGILETALPNFAQGEFWKIREWLDFIENDHQPMSFDFMEIETQSFEKLESARTSPDVGQPIPRRDRKWKPDFDSDTESISNLSDIENLQIEPTSKCKKSFKNQLKPPLSKSFI